MSAPEAPRDPAYPFILSAGERRSSTANTIFRDPAWRQKDSEGALRLSVEDAARLGIGPGGKARITTKRGSVIAAVEITDTLQAGHASLPNGLGLNIDGTDMGRVAFVRCLPNGCVAEVVMDDALIKQLSDGSTAIFVVFLLIIFFWPRGMFGRSWERT